MYTVKLRSVVVLIGRYPALADLSLDVVRSEIVLLRGVNGVGKSTLLHVCAGLRRLASGTAEVLGCDLVTNRVAVRRRVALLGHDTALYDELTAIENLRLWARAARINDASVPGALDRLDLTRRLWYVPVSQLSAGQRRRVALAAVVVRRPELWLLDEPCAGLDRHSRELVHDIVSEAADAGATVLIASHEAGTVEDLAGREVTMAGGAVICDESR